MNGNDRKAPSRGLRGRSDDVEERLERARAYLRAHHAGIEPDAAFASRVAARLDRPPAEMLAQVALRLLPATLSLVALLVWFSIQWSSSPGGAVTADSASADELLSWVLDEPEATP